MWLFWVYFMKSSSYSVGFQYGLFFYLCTSDATQAAKLCNNLVLGITMAGVCEGHALADRFGLDQKKLAEILNISSGRRAEVGSRK